LVVSIAELRTRLPEKTSRWRRPIGMATVSLVVMLV
jgi:hypothetical protein